MKIFYYLLTAITFTVCLTSSSLAQGPCVDFDSPRTPLNTSYTKTNLQIINLPSVQVFLDKFLLEDGTTTFGSASIRTASGFGRNRVLELNNVNIVVKYLNPVRLRSRIVSFDFSDSGGIENFSVNGSTVIVSQISQIPTRVNNVQVSVTTTTGGLKGRVKMVGKVKQFSIGGQELAVDNICQSWF